MKISYNWLQNYFEEKLPEPEKLSEGFTFHDFEVEEVEKVWNDTIFDIKVLPDRAHDCLSHWGIAKEVSAIFNLKIKNKENKSFEIKKTNLKIEIQTDKCLRYMGRIIRNIKVEESPDWLKEKLNAIGQKSINNIVDLANFVMFDLGNPIHAFDLDKLTNQKLIVRQAQSGEKITTLDKKEVNLDEGIMIIADGSIGSLEAREPLAIAGIKGGNKAEVDNNTKNIVIEVANFNSVMIRKTAKKINILTDAVKRYENEISPELCEKTMEEVSDLIHSLAGGEVEEIIDVYPNKIEQKIINVTVSYINKRLGSNFSKEEITSVWEKLSFDYKEKDDNFEIKIPLLRIDISGPHDLTEEVIRILGYDRLEEKIPEIKINKEPKINENFYKMLLVRKKFLEDGYSEVMTYTFTNKGEVEVLASASDKSFLRTNLTDGLKESIKLNKINLPLLDIEKLKIFEIGTIFKKSGEEIHVAYGDEKNITEITLDKFASEKLPLEEISVSSGIKKGEEETPSKMPWERDGASTRNFSAEKYPCILEGVSSEAKTFKPWSIYPFITRDIAIWVPSEVESDKVFKVIKENAGELLVREPKLFDKFAKSDRTSYAFRLVFQSYDRTLTDKEVSKVMFKIEEKIKENNWEVR